MNINQDDKRLIDGQHHHFTDQVNDLAIELQDGAYKLGLERGRSEGKAQRDELLVALKAMRDEFRGYDLPYGSKAYRMANEAIISVEGGAT